MILEVIAMGAESKVKSVDGGSVRCKDPDAASYLESVVDAEELSGIVAYAEAFRLDTASVEGALGGAAAKGHLGAAGSGGKRGDTAGKPTIVHIVDMDVVVARAVLPQVRGRRLVKYTLWHDQWRKSYEGRFRPRSGCSNSLCVDRSMSNVSGQNYRRGSRQRNGSKQAQRRGCAM